MKIRNSAALVLVGWYLMAPRGNADLHTVSSQWESLGSFDSADDCEAAKAAAINVAKQRADASPGDVNAKVALGLGISSQCVATDDPRLKPK